MILCDLNLKRRGFSGKTLHERLSYLSKKSLMQHFSNAYFLLLFIKLIRRAGNKTRFVKVAVTKVSDVSHPNACVPPKPLKLKIIKPAINTREV
jgi:hypothetical protein